MSKNLVETLVGALVLVIAFVFLYNAYKTTDIVGSGKSGYELQAKFDRADGLNFGGDVKVGGIKVGKVTSLTVDPKSFKAIVKMKIYSDIQFPSDSTAEIIGNGFLGDKYLSIVPGADDEHLADGGVIEFTQSSISLESLIGKFIFGGVDSNKDKTAKAEKH
jgi:phospholipid/cholesterol/gamma-HCH transport system substrate-binding protein